jgi:hypothetical protein
MMMTLHMKAQVQASSFSTISFSHGGEACVHSVLLHTHLCNLKPLQCKVYATILAQPTVKMLVTCMQMQVGHVDTHLHW